MKLPKRGSEILQVIDAWHTLIHQAKAGNLQAIKIFLSLKANNQSGAGTAPGKVVDIDKYPLE
ncbi:hypothetical protein [Desulfoscipio gibsoniae]|uniref:Uncharacterized protein n=1 Tax=Desulfoscipio gibsoniae DSM 7213 TaxID=767817 RepID=R4KD75_9FIRM|nr:hypothetical protein [Desulfoscipio gibsoniae]AGK99651.1 hypothetical protein Desgi_0031 [Desulfoscipio gibsoniae DSM 7213]